MKHPDFLDNRDFTGEDKKRPSTMSMDSSYQALEGAVKKLSEIASTRHDPRYLQEYIKTGINMAQSAASDHDFTVLIRSGREMYRANCVFAPYRHIRKISVFGSARIRNDEPAYERRGNSPGKPANTATWSLPEADRASCRQPMKGRESNAPSA